MFIKSQKKFLIMLLCLSTALSLSACGKSKEEKEQEKVEKEIEEMREELGLEEGEDIWDDIANEESMDAKKTATKGENKLYDKAPEWDTLKNPAIGIQIDDKFYKIGMTVGEIISIAQSSENEYDFSDSNYGYTPEKLVEGKSNSEIWVDKMGESSTWFYINYYNPSDDVASIDDCICYYIGLNSYSNASFPYTRILGLGYDEWTAMSYDDIESLADKGNLLAGYKVTKDGGSNETSWEFENEVLVSSGTKKNIQKIVFTIYLDMNTGKVCRYQIWSSVP